eukprot:SM000029S10443  [mRNA]  locus=s29:155748:156430:- [translate_table: standard]
MEALSGSQAPGFYVGIAGKAGADPDGDLHWEDDGDALDEDAQALDQLDPLQDPKRAKRILANRQSAQRSRVRKLQYISELEKRVNLLQQEIAALTPQVLFLDRQRASLGAENGFLKQRLTSVTQNTCFKDCK